MPKPSFHDLSTSAPNVALRPGDHDRVYRALRNKLFVGVVFAVSLSLSSGCSPAGSGAFSGEGLPSRRAARGEKILLMIESREDPVHVESIPGLAQCVTDHELFTVVSSALPLWHPPTVPSLLHELRFWGIHSQFSEEMVGKERSGKLMCDTLLSNSLAKENTTGSEDYLIDSPYGIHVVRNGTVDASGYRGEGHYGQLLAVLAESGVSTSTPVTTSSGYTGTINDLLQDAIMRYSPTLEQEFIAVALALYLPPTAKSWTDQFGDKHSFDDLTEILMTTTYGQGSCGGCHVPYALMTILRVDQEFNILSSSARQQTLRWFADLSGILERSQRAEGGWDSSWAGATRESSLYGDPGLDRITVTGHHLEWIALAPATVRPRLNTIKSAVRALVQEVEVLPDMGGPRLFKALLPCSHAARALCLFRQQNPNRLWKQYWSGGQLEFTRKGYKLHFRQESHGL